jgi:hypothetical protein
LTVRTTNYLQSDASPQSAYDWLYGGGEQELRCPTVMQTSWQTVGAQQYPDSPLVIDQSAYEAAIDTGHAIYATGGSDPVTIVVPTGEPAC